MCVCVSYTSETKIYSRLINLPPLSLDLVLIQRPLIPLAQRRAMTCRSVMLAQAVVWCLDLDCLTLLEGYHLGGY